MVHNRDFQLFKFYFILLYLMWQIKFEVEFFFPVIWVSLLKWFVQFHSSLSSVLSKSATSSCRQRANILSNIRLADNCCGFLCFKIMEISLTDTMNKSRTNLNHDWTFCWIKHWSHWADGVVIFLITHDHILIYWGHSPGHKGFLLTKKRFEALHISH